ncbi:thioesterase family protein [Pseudohongiella acticola]|jgi:acyl-CoA thioesterase|uniref:acyl-CoA thioesterase n=1 Tax=Pseudohongiella acticola TaxID=1524254 RepID=UPI0030EC32E9
MHPLDTAISLDQLSKGSYRAHTSAAYANMVGPFGGVTSALLLNAVMRHEDKLGDPISLTVNFAAPVADGEILVEAQPVRTNRSTQHWLMQATQNDEVVAFATAVTAVRRETWSAHEALPPRDAPDPLTLARMDTTDKPVWTQCYDMRYMDGDMPAQPGGAGEPDGEEQSHSYSCLWVRDEPPRPLDFVSLSAICDSYFPRIFIRRQRRLPIGTISMTTYFHTDTAMLSAQGEQFLLATAKALNFRNGYFDQTAEVWSADRQLLASTHQMVYFRD